MHWPACREVDRPNTGRARRNTTDSRTRPPKLRDWITEQTKGLGLSEAQALPSAKAGLEILRVAHPVIEAYQARKRSLGVLDFDDLLSQARDLLTGPHGPTLQKQLSSQLILLLVDEFQDTDPLQVELVKVLCGERLLDGRLFFVGDSKQSIYRFRGADPRVFRQLQGEIPDRGRLPLTLNFRSQRPILEFVNAMFCERLGPNYEALEASRDPLSSEAAIEFLWSRVEGDPAEKVKADQLRQCDADWIARRLAEIFAAGEIKVRDEHTKLRVPWRPATWQSCSARSRTCNIMRRPCGATAFRTTWWGAARFMPSRKSSTC